MKVFKIVCVLGIFPVLGLGCILAMTSAEKDQAEERSQTIASAAANQTKQEVKKVPLDSVYSTSSQKGLIRLPAQNSKQLDSVFEDFYRDMRGVGASNIFLAQGDDIDAAVLGSWEVYIAWQPCDTPARTTQSKKSEKFWVAAYLGISTSNPPAWEVKSVEVDDKRVRLKYAKGGKSTVTDRRQYHVWAPLGTMAPGSYLLELFDEDAGQVAMSRRVTIPAKK